MRVLHIQNTAGVATMLTEWCRERGVDSQVLATAQNDKFGHADADAWVMSRARWFYLKSILEARHFDVLVVHGNTRLISYLRFLGRPVILYCHGTELRSRPGDVIADLQMGLYKHLIVATPDLLDLLPDWPERVTYIPNPVHYMFLPGKRPQEPRAMTFSYGADQEALALARERGLELDILQRTFKWRQMPGLFEKYSHYIDVKRGHRGEMLIKNGVLSLTALEALLSGLTVVTQDGEVRGLPEKHGMDTAGRLFMEVLASLD